MSGAALGGSLFGIIGAIAGGVIGGVAGNSSTQKDAAVFNMSLDELIEYYFSCVHSVNMHYVEQISSFHNNNSAPKISPNDKQKMNKKGEHDPTKAEEKLNSLIGLASIKRQVMLMKASLKKAKYTGQVMNLHMCFYGNPGTGKTEVARLIADIFYNEKILPTNNFVETDRSGLVGEYIGWTGPKTHDVFKKAMGGVLFIDEAYALDGGAGNDFGKEAVATLLKDMEDYRGEICVILAGYKKPMEKMFTLNPGFKSRINRYINFPNYSPEEIKEILLLYAKNNKYTIEANALKEMVKIVMSHAEEEDFANAREARNLFNSICEIQALRTSNALSDTKITLEDVEQFKSDNNI